MSRTDMVTDHRLNGRPESQQRNKNQAVNTERDIRRGQSLIIQISDDEQKNGEARNIHEIVQPAGEAVPQELLQQAADRLHRSTTAGDIRVAIPENPDQVEPSSKHLAATVPIAAPRIPIAGIGPTPYVNKYDTTPFTTTAAMLLNITAFVRRRPLKKQLNAVPSI